MSSPKFKGRFSAYMVALKSASARTGAPLPSLVVSFGILHEITAILPLVGVFYGARALGIGERVINAVVTEDSSQSSRSEAGAIAWGRNTLKTWVEEGDRWAARVGTRYGFFGYEKGGNLSAAINVPGHIAGDVANAIVAYGTTKALLPFRIGISIYLSPMFSRQLVTSPMPKLHFKDTPQEESDRRSQKRARKERKRKRNPLGHDDECGTSSKRPHASASEDIPRRKWASSDEDDAGSNYGPEQASSSKIPSGWRENSDKPDYDTIHAELEEQRFRAKMFDALGDDERLDSIEAQFNDFGHVPDRWRSGGGGGKVGGSMHDEDDFLRLDPRNMDDEEYAEWVRTGMYRKTHAAEHAEHVRKKAAKAARRAEEHARKAETARLEKAMKEERRKKKQEQESRRLDYAREEYHMRWKILLSTPSDDDPLEISFHGIPWPIAAAYQSKADKSKNKMRATFSVDDLTVEAISAFLLDPDSGRPAEERKKERKERVREAFLRFHPDKFEGRFMQRVAREDEEKVRQAIGQVSRALNVLLSEGQ